ncbi:MAG: DUF932 domain-containing protein [Verrucomicrobiia bacterium]
MAHDILIENSKAAMMYYGKPPWHELGTALEGPATAAEAIVAAGLDWAVEKRPLFYGIGSNRLATVPNRFAMVRFSEKKGVVLGIVGKDYRPLQNRDAFAFFDPIVGENAAVYHTAGALGNGERVWVLAKLPGELRAVNDDIADKYLLLSNSHDGSSGVQIKFTPIRVVCQNTLSMALREGPTLTAFHLGSLPDRLELARQSLGIINQRFREMESAFQAMARVQIGKERLAAYYSKVFPDPSKRASEAATKRVAIFRSEATRLFDEGRGNRAPGVQGTLWAAYNGAVELVDYSDVYRAADRRLQSVWFGTGSQTKARAYAVALANMKEWRN